MLLETHQSDNSFKSPWGFVDTHIFHGTSSFDSRCLTGCLPILESLPFLCDLTVPSCPAWAAHCIFLLPCWTLCSGWPSSHSVCTIPSHSPQVHSSESSMILDKSPLWVWPSKLYGIPLGIECVILIHTPSGRQVYKWEPRLYRAGFLNSWKCFEIMI